MKKRNEEFDEFLADGIEYNEKAADLFKNEIEEEELDNDNYEDEALLHDGVYDDYLYDYTNNYDNIEDIDVIEDNHDNKSKKAKKNKKITKANKDSKGEETKEGKDDAGYSVPTRIIKILNFIYNGDRTKEDIFNFLKYTNNEISAATLNRDIAYLVQSNFIEKYMYIGVAYYKFVSRKLRGFDTIILPEEFRTFRVLKSLNKTFVSDRFLNSVSNLERKLTGLLSNQEIATELMNIGDEEQNDKLMHLREIWNYIPGLYNYEDSGEVINKLFRAISNKYLIKIHFRKEGTDEKKVIDAVPASFYSFDGTLYIIFYSPYYKKYMSLSVHFIDFVEDGNPEPKKIPELNLDDYLSNRFGVFEKEPVEVKLNINRKYIRYFENRKWHPSQKTRKNNTTGDISITMTVPLTTEFIAWIIKWTDAITVVEPHELIVKVKEGARRILANYEK